MAGDLTDITVRNMAHREIQRMAGVKVAVKKFQNWQRLKLIFFICWQVYCSCFAYGTPYFSRFSRNLHLPQKIYIQFSLQVGVEI